MRAVEDYYVDRPGVEEPRGLKLTGTNRSIGLNGHLFMHGDDCVAQRKQTTNATDDVSSCLVQDARVRLVDLAAMPGGPHLIPSRTQSLSPPGPMVLCLKAWESRSLPGLQDPRERKVQRTLNHNDGLGRTLPAALNTRPFAYQRRSLPRDGAAR